MAAQLEENRLIVSPSSNDQKRRCAYRIGRRNFNAHLSIESALKQWQTTRHITRRNAPGERHDRWLPFKDLYPDFGQPLL